MKLRLTKQACIIITILFAVNIKAQIPAPSGVEAQAYQREIELHWDPDTMEGLSWEVVVDDNPGITSSTNSLILTKLSVNKEYNIKIRARKDSETSAFSEVQVTTKPLNNGIDDIRRIPYLRTIANQQMRYGDVPQTIEIFFNELGSNSANLTYYIDNKQVHIIDNKLTFPKLGKQTLKIIIEEPENRHWELEYKLKVKK